MKLGFIGLGNMGAPMARNLLKAGHELIIYDVVRANVDALEALGDGRAAAVSSPAAIVRSGVEAVSYTHLTLPTNREV